MSDNRLSINISLNDIIMHLDKSAETMVANIISELVEFDVITKTGSVSSQMLNQLIKGSLKTRSKKKSTRIIKGLIWDGNKDSIHILYKELIERKFIEPIDCDKSKFIEFFSGKVEKKKCFKWKVNYNLLAYLFEELAENYYLSTTSFNYNSLIKNTGFFVNRDLKHIKNLKQLKNLYTNSETGSPNNNKIIDDIILKMNQS